MRVAMPLNFCGMRLHMSIHCSSKSCWVKDCSSSLGRALGSEPSRVPGMMDIFLGCAFLITFLNDMLIPDFSMGRLAAGWPEVLGVLDELDRLVELDEPVPLASDDTTRSAAATCGAAFWGWADCVRCLNRNFNLLGLRPLPTASSGWVICAISMSVSSTSRRLLLDWR